MKIKIFTGPITTGHYVASIEQQVNEFIFVQHVIDIKQSISPDSNLLVITVMYE